QRPRPKPGKVAGDRDLVLSVLAVHRELAVARDLDGLDLAEPTHVDEAGGARRDGDVVVAAGSADRHVADGDEADRLETGVRDRGPVDDDGARLGAARRGD